MGDPSQASAQDAWLAHPSLGLDVARYAAPAAAEQESSAASKGGSPAKRGSAPAKDGSAPLAIALTFNDTWESKEFRPFGADSYLKGGIKFKLTSKGELLPKGVSSGASVGVTTNRGEKGDVELCKNKLKELLNSTSIIKEDRATLNHEVSAKQVKLSVAYKVTFDVGLSWFSPLVSIEFTVAAVDWEKLKANPDDFTAGGIELAGGGKGQGVLYETDQWQCKLGLEGTISGSVKLNWAKILLELAKKYGWELGAAGAESAAVGGTGATGAAAVAAAPLAGVLGGIVGGLALCAGCMKMIAVLGEQGRDSTRCAQEGARLLRAYADSYAATVRGGSGPSKEGNQDGEAHLTRLMAMMNTTREDAVDMCKESDQKYEQIAWVALRPQMREAVKKAHAELHYGDIHGPSLQEFLGDNSNY